MGINRKVVLYANNDVNRAKSKIFIAPESILRTLTPFPSTNPLLTIIKTVGSKQNAAILNTSLARFFCTDSSTARGMTALFSSFPVEAIVAATVSALLFKDDEGDADLSLFLCSLLFLVDVDIVFVSLFLLVLRVRNVVHYT